MESHIRKLFDVDRGESPMIALPDEMIKKLGVGSKDETLCKHLYNKKSVQKLLIDGLVLLFIASKILKVFDKEGNGEWTNYVILGDIDNAENWKYIRVHPELEEHSL